MCAHVWKGAGGDDTDFKVCTSARCACGDNGGCIGNLLDCVDALVVLWLLL